MSGSLEQGLVALARAVELGEGRLDDDSLAFARTVVTRAGQRLGLGLESTVVALAGPTGTGKSSLFNALCEAEITQVSRRRPTTAQTASAFWGPAPKELLDWLEVRLRHSVGDGELSGLVLLDLPDLDSVENAHRLEVDRLIELVDLLVWVVDPQKYADASLHERYLQPLAGYTESMAIVLNQSDLLTPDAVQACRADLERVLDEDGAGAIPVLTTSVTAGHGLSELRALLAARVRERGAAVARLSADLHRAAAGLALYCGESARTEVGREDRERLVGALATAAGIPAVVDAVARAHRRRGVLRTGWPLLRWLGRLRPDPLRRLHLGDRPAEDARTSLPRPTAVQRSQVDSGARMLARGAASDLPVPWPRLVRAAATAREPELGERLDRAVAGTDLGMREPRWWTLAAVAQKLLLAMAVLGAIWLVALAVLGYLQLDDVLPTPEIEGVALPTLLLGGGILVGLIFAFLTRWLNGAGARRRARAAQRALLTRTREVATELVIQPVEGELRAYAEFCAAIAEASGPRKRGLVGRQRNRAGLAAG